jgi:hypothetical protein
MNNDGERVDEPNMTIFLNNRNKLRRCEVQNEFMGLEDMDITTRTDQSRRIDKGDNREALGRGRADLRRHTVHKSCGGVMMTILAMSAKSFGGVMMTILAMLAVVIMIVMMTILAMFAVVIMIVMM